MGVTQAKQLKALKRENQQLKRLVADLARAEGEVAVTRASLAVALSAALAGRAAGGAHDVGVGVLGGRVQQQPSAAEGLVVGVRDGDQQAGGGCGGVAHRRLRSLRSRYCTPQYALPVDAAQRSMCEDAA